VINLLILCCVLIALVAGSLFLLIDFGWKRGWTDWHYLSTRPQLLSTSPYVRPLFLFLIRLFMFLYIISIIIYALYVKREVFFEYFTQWNFSLMCFYFLLGSYFSLRRMVNPDEEKLRGFVHVLAQIFWILFHMCFVLAFFIDLVVWGILFPWAMIYDKQQSSAGDQVDIAADLFTIISVSAHCINFFFIFIELVLNRLPFQTPFFLFLPMWASFYCIFQWLYWYSGGRWVYPFMNLEKYTACIWYLCFVLFLLAFHQLTVWVHSKFKAKHCEISYLDNQSGLESSEL